MNSMNERAKAEAGVAQEGVVRTSAGDLPRLEVERASTIVASLGRGVASAEEVFAAFEELDTLSPDVVRDALAAWTGPAPDLDRLDPELRSVHGLPPRPLRFRTTSVAKDADVLDLGPLAEEQLRVAGTSWDGLDLPPEERLDGERVDSFAGTLERRVVADADTGRPLFDVLLFAGDSGVIFRAGTTEQVGAVAYGTVEMKDRRERIALMDALAEAWVPLVLEEHTAGETPSATTTKIEATKKASVEKMKMEKKASAGAKKASAGAKDASAGAKKAGATKKKASAGVKKAGATKKKASAGAKKATAAKKPSSETSAAMTTSSKRAVATKVRAVTKKASAKKADVKKAPAKKTVANRATRKAPAKKTVANRVTKKAPAKKR